MKVTLLLAASLLLSLTGCVNHDFPMIPMTWSMRGDMNRAIARAEEYNKDYSMAWPDGWMAGYDGLSNEPPKGTAAVQAGWKAGWEAGATLRISNES